MKVTDLMVGDWIHNNYTNENYQVWPAFFTQATNYGKRLDATFEDVNIAPIPLTEEILEKNGWEHCKVETCKSLWEYHGLHLRHVMIKRSDGRWVANIDGKVEIGCDSSYLRINIYYVHQLQHALRLCGMEKEIML